MFIQLICKARRLKKRRDALLKEKQDAILASQNQHGDIILTRRQRYRHFCYRIRRSCIRCFTFPKHTLPYRLCFNLRHHGTCEHFLATSIAGFLGGFLLTYIFFMFFVLQLNFTLSTATIMCSFFGSILTIGLAFSYKVRCVVFLVIPQFFSKKGRQALLAYAYILAITGPAKNTLNNMSILGESLACGQEQLKAAVKQILETIKKPFYAIRDAIKKVVITVKEIVAKIKEILLGIKRIIMSLVKIVKSAFEFIAGAMNVCNQEFGTPYNRCHKVFEDAVIDCNAKLGSMFNWLCNLTYLVRTVCYLAKAFDFLCMIVDFIKSTVSAIVTKVKQFVRHIRTMFYVRIKFSHSYRMESNHSKSMADITTGIVTEIKQRSQGLIKIFDFMSSAASLFFIFMVVKVVYYRYKFLTNEMFDNKFITKDFRMLDIRRAQLGLETVLPLNHRERKLYISTSSMRLVKKEKSRLSQAAMILLMSTLKLSTHMATDYSLYWIMTKIRFYGRFQSKIDAPNMPMVVIQGDGFLAALLKGIVKAFQPLGINLEIDTIPCLPDPIPPDYDRYIQIASLLILCWFLAIFEPYGLRFRHSVMCYYHPTRAKERAIWLYNHILRSRSSFLKFARRQLKRKVKSDKSISKVTCMEFIRAKAGRYKLCVLIFGISKQNYCLLCGEVYREGDKKVFIKCQTPKCQGLFCEQCFNDLQNLCTVCLDPISYGDLSDISEERDSSEDEAKQKRKALQEEKRKAKKKKKTRKVIGMGKAKKLKKKLRKKRKRNISMIEEQPGEEEEIDFEEEQSEYQDKIQLLSSTDEEEGEEGHTTDYDPNYDTDWSSDYDLSYQLNKDISKMSTDNTPKVDLQSDVEKQKIPNYASMQDYHTDVVYYLNWSTEDIEAYDTSSLITEIQEASLEHLNSSPPVGNQGWLLKKETQTQANLMVKTSSSDFTSEKSAPSSYVFFQSEESEYEEDFYENDDGIALKRLNSKLSMEEVAVGTNSPIDIFSSEESSEISNGSLLTTPNSYLTTDNTNYDSSYRGNYNISMMRPSLEPISEEFSKSKTTQIDTISDHLLNLSLSQGSFTKEQKEWLNEATSKESKALISIGTSMTPPYDEPEVESLNLPDENSSLEVSPLSVTYISKQKPIPFNKHPDVPELNLDFLDNRDDPLIQSSKYCECPSSRSLKLSQGTMTSFEKSTKSVSVSVDATRDTSPDIPYTNSEIETETERRKVKETICNCHKFKHRVTYNVINEFDSSPNETPSYATPPMTITPLSAFHSTETSSLISPLNKSKRSGAGKFYQRFKKFKESEMEMTPDSLEENDLHLETQRETERKPQKDLENIFFRPDIDFCCSPAILENVTSTSPFMTPEMTQISSPKRSYSMNTSQMSVKKCSLDYSTTSYPDNVNNEFESPSSQSGTRSLIDYSTGTRTGTFSATENTSDSYEPSQFTSHAYDTVAQTLSHNYDTAETSSMDTVFVLPKAPPKKGFLIEGVTGSSRCSSQDLVLDSHPSQKDLYKERIRKYYRHLDYDSIPAHIESPKIRKKTPRPKKNLVKSWWNSLMKKKT